MASLPDDSKRGSFCIRDCGGRSSPGVAVCGYRRGGTIAMSSRASGTRAVLMSVPAKQVAAIFSWSVCRIVGTGWTVAVPALTWADGMSRPRPALGPVWVGPAGCLGSGSSIFLGVFECCCGSVTLGDRLVGNRFRWLRMEVS